MVQLFYIYNHVTKVLHFHLQCRIYALTNTFILHSWYKLEFITLYFIQFYIMYLLLIFTYVKLKESIIMGYYLSERIK